MIIHALDLMGMHAAAQDGLARWATQLGMPAGQFSEGDGCFMDPWIFGNAVVDTMGPGGALPFDRRQGMVFPLDPENSQECGLDRASTSRVSEECVRTGSPVDAGPVAAQQHLGQHGRASLVLDRCQFLFRDGTICGSDRADRPAGRPGVPGRGGGLREGHPCGGGEVAGPLAGDPRARRHLPVVPPAGSPYMRGPASRYMPTLFGDPAHTPGLYADAIRGGVHFINRSRLLGPENPRAQGMIDVLEDRLLSEHDRLAMRTKGYDPEKHWFSHAGWYYQCGIERTADVHLQWDDVPNFLRSFYNDYAVDIVVGPYTFDEHTTRGPSDKSFEEAVFLERLRLMLVMEEGDTLWLARATPRAWLEQGKKIAVSSAPTDFGRLAYQIVSDVDHGKITATVQMPSRNPPQAVLLRLRHPQAATIKSVAVNGRPWTDFEPAKELIRLHGLQGATEVEATY